MRICPVIAALKAVGADYPALHHRTPRDVATIRQLHSPPSHLRGDSLGHKTVEDGLVVVRFCHLASIGRRPHHFPFHARDFRGGCLSANEWILRTWVQRLLVSVVLVGFGVNVSSRTVTSLSIRSAAYGAAEPPSRASS